MPLIVAAFFPPIRFSGRRLSTKNPVPNKLTDLGVTLGDLAGRSSRRRRSIIDTLLLGRIRSAAPTFQLGWRFSTRCITVDVSEADVAALVASSYLPDEAWDEAAIEVLMSDLVFELETERSTRTQVGKRVTTRRRDA